jgi:ankyrin repeat protein
MATFDGCTPLFIAASWGHLAIVRYLVQQGADKNKAAEIDSVLITPLDVALLMDHFEVAQYLPEQGAD